MLTWPPMSSLSMMVFVTRPERSASAKLEIVTVNYEFTVQYRQV